MANSPTLIKAGSYSRLKVFATCPRQAKLKYINKIKEPERPALPKGKEYPNDRGSRVHDYAEHYVANHKDHKALIPEMLNFEEEFALCKALYKQHSDRFFMEKMWLFDDSWSILPAKTEPWDKRIWMRIIIDLCLFNSTGTIAYVVDHKTGRKYGNEVPHGEQTQLYALAVALKFPEVETIITELWYLDQYEVTRIKYTRKQALRFLENWNNKMMRMTTAVNFPAKANAYSCNFCAYKTGTIGKKGQQGTGDCDLNP